jgi:hypothetical protein
MFVIMLDDLLEVHLHHWPISGRNKDLEALRLQTQYSGSAELIPRSQVEMILRENKSLINTKTGMVDRGAIYEANDEKGSVI